MVELMVSLAMSGLVVGSMLVFFVTQTKSSRFADVRIEAVQRARFASEILRREMSLAGAGIPDAQPLVVYAGPDDFVMSADLASSTPGDRIAVYYLPGAPLSHTEGADSASMTLPGGLTYPLRWYGPDGTPGPAETVRFSFVSLGAGRYALARSVNGLVEDTLLRGLSKINGGEFFTYTTKRADGTLAALTGGPIQHRAAVHDSPGDTGTSALTDSIKMVHVAFNVNVKGRRGVQSVERAFAMGVALQNAGLVRNAACGDAPDLGVVPAATVTSLDPPSVTVTWPPALDERSGEADVYQYTLYRRELTESVARPIASLPPDPNLSSYTYIDTDVESGKTYIYLLGATDCTPTQSSLTQSTPVDVPAA